MTTTSHTRNNWNTRFTRLMASALLVGSLGLAACGDDDGTNVNLTASAIAIVSGNNQTGTLGLALAAPLVVKVTNSDGDPVEGKTVHFSTTGTGTLGSSSATTNAEGKAQTSYTLGLLAGAQTVIASVDGVTSTVSFTVTGAVAVNPQIVVVSGNSQTAVRNTQLAQPLIIKVQDGSGNALPGVTVTWSATGGAVGSATTTTGANGQAQTTYTLPNAAGANTITATIQGTATTVTFTATGT